MSVVLPITRNLMFKCSGFFYPHEVTPEERVQPYVPIRTLENAEENNQFVDSIHNANLSSRPQQPASRYGNAPRIIRQRGDPFDGAFSSSFLDPVAPTHNVDTTGGFGTQKRLDESRAIVAALVPSSNIGLSDQWVNRILDTSMFNTPTTLTAPLSIQQVAIQHIG